MTDALDTFFSAWAETDAAKRRDLIAAAVAPTATYSDPRSGSRLSGIDAIADYVGMFSANAPGWRAEVSARDTVNGYCRAVVVFGGPGPDGQDIAQHGTYIADLNADGTIVSLAGFAGQEIG